MLVIPVAYHTAPADRPCFLIHKQSSRAAFTTYYEKAMEWWELSKEMFVSA